MIKVEKFSISSDLKELTIHIKNTTGSFFNKVFLWSYKNYGNSNKVIDISKDFQREFDAKITYKAASFGLENFSGIFFLDVKSNNPEDAMKSNSVTGITANLYSYKKSLLDKALSVQISGCNDVVDNCQECKENLCYIQTMISALEVAIQSKDFGAVTKVAKELDKHISLCHSCLKPEPGVNYAGKDMLWETINNKVVINESEVVQNLKNKLLEVYSEG